MQPTFKNSVECIEGHNAGMPVKAVFLPHIPGETMLKKKAYCESNLDYIRQMLTYEPRSGSNSYGVVITAPSHGDAHVGAIYFDPSGWRDMCGHATMFAGSLLVQKGMIETKNKRSVEIVIDTPAGQVKLKIHMNKDSSIDHVSLVNVPSFILETYKLNLKKYGELDVPVVFGGDFYAIIDMDAIGLVYSRENLPILKNLALEVLGLLRNKNIAHPAEKGLKGVYGVRFQSKAGNKENRMYGILFFGNYHRVSLDRSPSGTGSSAHLAYLYFTEKSVGLGGMVEFVSTTETVFACTAVKEVNIDHYKAIVPEISSIDKACFITGFSTYVLDSEDKLEYGFEPIEPF
jgi:Proline racemase